MDDGSVTVEWWEDVDGACTRFRQVLPGGDAAPGPAIAGGCEVDAVAYGPDDVTIWLAGGTLTRVAADAVDPLEVPEGWLRRVAFGEDGGLLVLTADDAGEVSDDGARFREVTWGLREGEWVALEEVSETLRTVRAIAGGPVWAGRAPGSSADLWTLENAPGFTLALAHDLKPRKVKVPDVVAWGRVPVGGADVIVRYTILGVPSPVGPVYFVRGKKWSLLDDSHFSETPASVDGRGDYVLLRYEGSLPVLFDRTTGRRLWSQDEQLGRTAARLLPGP